MAFPCGTQESGSETKEGEEHVRFKPGATNSDKEKERVEDSLGWADLTREAKKKKKSAALGLGHGLRGRKASGSGRLGAEGKRERQAQAGFG